MIFLDTNVVSNLAAPIPSHSAVAWLDDQSHDQLRVPLPVIAELSAGAEEFRRRTGSDRYRAPLQRLLLDYATRIVDVDREAALEYGRVIARRNGMGRPTKPFDALIAAMAIVHGATLATRNTRDFEGLDLKLVNPFEAGT